MMKNVNKNTKILLIVGILLLAILLIGGTYAFLNFSLSVSNGNIQGDVECFDIQYDISNDGEDESTDMTGVLFPAKKVTGGLSGKVAIRINPSCSITGTGSLYLHIDDETSNILVQNVSAHCENSQTLETGSEYLTSTECQNNMENGTWVTNGTALKYVLYNNSTATGNALSKGYITSGNIGGDILIYDGFSVNSSWNEFYVFIWMDGYLSDDNYNNQPFGGNIHASVMQTE